MSERYPHESGYSVDSYFALVAQGTLGPRDRVELLDGVIVAEPPMDPPHASAITLVAQALERALGAQALVRVQAPLIAGKFSVPEPDVAVVPGTAAHYYRTHPRSALLVVEASCSSLQQDRLSKSRIYAGADVPEYWIINVRDQVVEIYRRPDQNSRVYTDRLIAAPGASITLVAFPTSTVAVADLLPSL
jgi:Uma2 family endonuclease